MTYQQDKFGESFLQDTSHADFKQVMKDIGKQKRARDAEEINTTHKSQSTKLPEVSPILISLPTQMSGNTHWDFGLIHESKVMQEDKDLGWKRLS